MLKSEGAVPTIVRVDCINVSALIRPTHTAHMKDVCTICLNLLLQRAYGGMLKCLDDFNEGL